MDVEIGFDLNISCPFNSKPTVAFTFKQRGTSTGIDVTNWEPYYTARKTINPTDTDDSEAEITVDPESFTKTDVLGNGYPDTISFLLDPVTAGLALGDELWNDLTVVESSQPVAYGRGKLVLVWQATNRATT